MTTDNKKFHSLMYADPDHDFQDPNAPLPLSKSQRKRDATALQQLGEQLARLTAAQLKRIPLPEDLRAAVQLARSITQRGGRQRQLQYVGKMMRQLTEAELAIIHTELTTMQVPRR